MKQNSNDQAWLRVVLILGAIAYGIASNDDYETAQRVHVAYHVK